MFRQSKFFCLFKGRILCMGLNCGFRSFFAIFLAKLFQAGGVQRVPFRHIRFVQNSVHAVAEPNEPQKHPPMAYIEAALQHRPALPQDRRVQVIGARMQQRQHRIARLNIQSLQRRRLARRHALGPPMTSAHYEAVRGV
jgi:hypothetical protein